MDVSQQAEGGVAAETAAGAAWIPVTVVPTSLATVAIDTFMTELSSVIKNCADASVSSTPPAAPAAAPSARPGATPASRLTSIQATQSR